MFKVGHFQEAKILFTNLLLQENAQFRGRDRRLFYNKAVCELQMGFYADCVQTIKSYLKHFKSCYKEMDEVPLPSLRKQRKAKVQLKRGGRLLAETQFTKVHCHPTAATVSTSISVLGKTATN